MRILLLASLLIPQLSIATTETPSTAVLSIKTSLGLEIEPGKREYIKYVGQNQNGNCVVNIENAKEEINITITNKSYHDNFVNFDLPASGKTYLGDQITDFRFRNTGMFISASSVILKNTSLRERVKQKLQISINTSTTFTVNLGRNSNHCTISNF